jgi:23S rRNA pseudouridine1911/1915/1917 synthase
MEEPRVEIRTLLAAAAGERLDRYVAEALTDLSRTAVQRLIEEGNVTVNGKRSSPSQRLRAGDEILVHIPPPEPVDLQPEAIPLDVLYEDADLLVINKSAGLVVHPGAGHRSGTLVNAVLAHAPDLTGVGGELRPGIVHRLDKDTSGVMVMAKHDQALQELQRQFKRRSVEKRYSALVLGDLPQDEGLIEAPIARDRRQRQRMAVRAGGKEASTRWRVVGRFRDAEGQRYTLLDVELLTGRTHQIRVHLAWMGYPLAGDRVYAPPRAAVMAPRQFLHARELSLDHPTTAERLHFEVPLPPELEQVLAALTSLEPR